MKNILLLLTAILAYSSCSTPRSDISERRLIGTWANVSLLVTMKQLEMQDSVLEAKEGEWEKVLKMKPILTEFRADGTFTSEYTDLKEELIKKKEKLQQ
mgnify:CR=1 FL=1